MIAARSSSCGWRKSCDEQPKPNTGGLVVLITKRVQALQDVGHGFRLGCRRHGERKGESAADHQDADHGHLSLLCRMIQTKRIIVHRQPLYRRSNWVTGSSAPMGNSSKALGVERVTDTNQWPPSRYGPSFRYRGHSLSADFELCGVRVL
jgi:hypothetical protein